MLNMFTDTIGSAGCAAPVDASPVDASPVDTSPVDANRVDTSPGIATASIRCCA